MPNISFDLGIIQKQTITGSAISYLGVLLGFVTTGILFPQLFSTAENGVIKLLVANAALLGQLGTLGFTGVITRMFTYFRDKKSNHHGFMHLGILVSLAGFILASLTFYLLKDWILIGKDKADSEMIGKLVGYVIPMILATVFFQLFDNYYKVLYNAAGAALASLMSYSIFVAIRHFYLQWNYGFQPLGFNHLKVVLIALATLMLQYLLPTMTAFIVDNILRSLFMIVVFSSLSILFQVSDEVMRIKLAITNKFKRS